MGREDDFFFSLPESFNRRIDQFSNEERRREREIGEDVHYDGDYSTLGGEEGGESDGGGGRGTSSTSRETKPGQVTDNMAKCDWYHCASFPRRLRFRERLSRCQAVDMDLE